MCLSRRGDERKGDTIFENIIQFEMFLGEEEEWVIYEYIWRSGLVTGERWSLDREIMDRLDGVDSIDGAIGTVNQINGNFMSSGPLDR